MSDSKDDAIARAQQLAVTVSAGSGREDVSSPLETLLTIEFETAALPSAVSNFSKFAELMQERMGARVSRNLGQLAAKMDDLPRLSIVEMDQRLPIAMSFESGRLTQSKGGNTEFVLVHFVVIAGGGDVIRAGVFGDSDDAELAVAKTYECIWDAAGQSRPWNEGRHSIHSKGFVTSTLEDLDCSFDRLFSPGVDRFLQDLSDVKSGSGVAMGVRPLDNPSGEIGRINPHVAVKLRNLEFVVHVIDLDSGRVWECQLAISPKLKTTKGKGTYNVVSELPLSKHRVLVRRLNEALRTHGA